MTRAANSNSPSNITFLHTSTVKTELPNEVIKSVRDLTLDEIEQITFSSENCNSKPIDIHQLIQDFEIVYGDFTLKNVLNKLDNEASSREMIQAIGDSLEVALNIHSEEYQPVNWINIFQALKRKKVSAA